MNKIEKSLISIIIFIIIVLITAIVMEVTRIKSYIYKDFEGNVGIAYECSVNDYGYMYCSSKKGTFAVDYFKGIK